MASDLSIQGCLISIEAHRQHTNKAKLQLKALSTVIISGYEEFELKYLV